MGNTSNCYVLALLVTGLAHLCVGLHFRAYFDKADIRGYVLFGQNTVDKELTITFNFRVGLRSFDQISFAITANPSVYDDWCKNVGDVVYNMTETHGMINYDSNFTDNMVKIMGKDSILGKSLVLYEKNEKNETIACACSTILPHSEVLYADARINSPEIGGHFTFIRSVAGGDTFIYGALQHVHETTSGNHIYSVYISADTAGHDGSCAPLEQMYNPRESSGACDDNQQSDCKIGDLSSKHGKLSLGDKGGSGMIRGVDVDLPLHDDFSIISHYVVVKLTKIVGNSGVENKIVACGKINIAGPLEAISIFDEKKHEGISGHLKFSQQSPYHFTKVNTELEGLANRVGGYHVHRFPISSQENPCSGASVGGHVNTWDVDKSKSPKFGSNGSLDQYEVGDLSGRYGGLHGMSSFKVDAMDANIPLYGLYTILGRSIVIHESKPKNPRFVCSNIEPKDYKVKMSTKVDLRSGSDTIGRVYASQWVQANGITTRTTIVVDVPPGEGNNHLWSIRDKEVGTTCPSYGDTENPIYNPVKMTGGNFCSERNPFLCKIGDLSGKVGKFNMEKGKRFFSDANLPMLTGPMTAAGHSLVIYKADDSSEPLACGNIVPVPGVSRVASNLTFFIKDKTLVNTKQTELYKMLRDGFDFPENQAYRINSLKTSKLEDDDDDDVDCFRVDFYMIDTNTSPHASSYRCTLADILKTPAKMGSFKRCEVEFDDEGRRKYSFAMGFTPSVVMTTMLSTLLVVFM